MKTLLFLPLAAVLVLSVSLQNSLRADLRPDEIVILAVKRSPKSLELAEYYARMRKIPSGRICVLDVPPGGNLSRVEWQETVRPFIANWLRENGLATKVRCLVTVWDVPYKIGRQDKPRKRLASLAEQRARYVTQMNEIIGELNLLGGEADGKPEPFKAEATRQQVVGGLQAAVQAAQQRVKGLDDADAQSKANSGLTSLVARAGGLRALIQIAASRRATNAQQQQQLIAERSTLQGRLIGLVQGRAALEQLPEAVERDEQILSLIQVVEGTAGCLQWLDLQTQLGNKNESNTSFDSELSLVLWPSYPEIRWQANHLQYRFDAARSQLSRTTLMVARLEAPTFALAKGLVDTAIQVEASGLKGKVYLDSRGIAKPANARPGSYGDYDESLRDLKKLLSEHTKLTIVHDDKPALFGKGDCPEAAIYCGWYSLARYLDAFQWQPGAVAYHMASSEAVTIRDPKSEVWCKRMLEDGVCATLGPVAEPYLSAFPRPSEFFPLLLSGKYPLVECYYRTKPFNSWQMVLIGDPLYNPFKNAPALSSTSLPEEQQRLFPKD